MGSVWCKPSDMRQDCSPKINIHSLLNRISSQVCPSKCRYPQTTRTKPRPRSAVLSQGQRPDISPPLVQPIPPPRKKRKHQQDLSRSEEVLCQPVLMNPALRTAISLPSVCNPDSSITKNATEVKTQMASIAEESTYAEINSELDSLPPSEVYFMKKEEKPLAFSNETKIIEITNTNELINNIKQGSDTFTATSDTVFTNELLEERNETNKKVVNKDNQEKQKNSDENNSNNKLNFVKDQKDLESIKKWQDAMKTRWLQSILVESEPKDIGNQVTVNNSLQINISANIDSEKSDPKLDPVISTEEKNRKNSLTEITNNNKIYENLKRNTQEQIPKLIVTPKALSETLERLQSNQTTNQDDNVYNNRNLVYSSENLNNSNNIIKDNMKQENKKDCLKLDKNSEEKINSNRNSRHSSITDSLQEFESSIYDMLQQSAKDNMSDEDESLVIINIKNNSNFSNNNNIINNNDKNMINVKPETPQSC